MALRKQTGFTLNEFSSTRRIAAYARPHEKWGMPIVIQDSTTGKYAAARGRWTRNVANALRFEQVLRAWEEIGERRLSGVRIMFWPPYEQAGFIVDSI